MRLVMATYAGEEKCILCRKIETKYGRIRKEQVHVRRWQKESGRNASTAASVEIIEKLEREVEYLLRKEESLIIGIAHDSAAVHVNKSDRG